MGNTTNIDLKCFALIYKTNVKCNIMQLKCVLNYDLCNFIFLLKLFLKFCHFRKLRFNIQFNDINQYFINYLIH